MRYTKKIILLILIHVFIYNCADQGASQTQTTNSAVTDSQSVANAKGLLNFTDFNFSPGDNENSITQNFTLPLNGSDGTSITWSSSSSAISINGTNATVTRPTVGGDINVTLTATITKNGVTETKLFVVLVKTTDVTAPGGATNPLIFSGQNQLSLVWVNPVSADFAGVLILRRQGSPVANMPVQGTKYTANDIIGTSSVVNSTNKNSYIDTTLTGGITYYYMIFAYDQAYNYAAGVSISGIPYFNPEIGSFTSVSSSNIATHFYNGYGYSFSLNPTNVYSIDVNKVLGVGTATGATWSTYGQPAFYNFFVYKGGKTGTGACSCGFLCTVTYNMSLSSGEYAPVDNLTGNLGAVTSITATWSVPYMAYVYAYNGYLYSFGGYGFATSSSCGPGISGSYLSVSFAPINIDGTLGAQVATQSLPYAGYNAKAVAYNGYMYVIPGIDYSNFGMNTTYHSVILYANINIDGSLGAWNTINGSSVGLNFTFNGQNMFVRNGILYLSGGSYGAPPQANPGYIWYSYINPDGTLKGFSILKTMQPAQTGDLFIYGNELWTLDSNGGIQWAPFLE